ncbi:hypothetical protein A3K64_03635 [Candidatus Micrarchaeota archaeon RBG_16_36_9]|nr:MAG: hypothetical protein A3K64_03635 [Candidatus Micrarchaeota archaeon RBG_16_36_9]
MDTSAIKIMLITLIFISVFSVVGYACDTVFCSSLACTKNYNCHDTCDRGFWLYGNKTCSSTCYFSNSSHCKFEKKVCADSDTTDNFPIIGGCVKSCTAGCDQNSDCKDKCVDDVKYYSGSCNLTSTCSCSYQIEDCGLKDGWYNTTNVQWIDDSQCTQKEQAQQEYREYACNSTSSSNCYYNVENHRWIDSDKIRNKEDGTSCDDDLFCTINDRCTSGVCSGSTRNCSSNNSQEIATCDNDPDNNPFTFDYSTDFTGSCVEDGNNLGHCTTGYFTITHTCADFDSTDNFPVIGGLVRTCTAQCDQNEDCSCPVSGCVNNDFYNYPTFGTCNESCNCNCTPSISYNDSRCVESFITVNKTVQTTELNCQGTTITLVVNGIGTGIVGRNVTITDFLPSYVNLDNLTSECSYDNNTREIMCNLNDVNAGDTRTINFNVSLSQLGNVLVDLYPESGVSFVNSNGNDTFVSFPETHVNVLGFSGATEICDDGIDNNCNGLADCNDTSCSSNSHCTQSFSVPSSGGGGALPIISTSTPAVCGNEKCENGETCSSCSKDCLKQGQICCDKIAYDGNCCTDYDCGGGYECTLGKTCRKLVLSNATSNCTEDWICADWSECVNGNQTRTCVDSNSCNTNLSKPEESRQCEVSTGPTGLFIFLTSPLGLLSIISTIILILLVLFRKRIGTFFKKGTSVVNYQQPPVKNQTENL